MNLVFKDYFTQLFNTASPTTKNFHKVVDNITGVLLIKDKEMIDKPFTTKEVEDAIFSIGPLKAPRSDGFHVKFYHKYWNIIRPTVTNYILEVLDRKREIKEIEIKHTYLVLIPKLHKLERPNHLGPISMCNVLYKMVAKTITNGLKQVHP